MNDGSMIEKIDLDKVNWRGSREFFDSLAATLETLDDKDESYDFTWVGKRKAVIEAGAPINKTFRPNIAASKNWDTTENLFIEGDNLDALKLLQESYLGKVKMIYIDPPYNTGKDFVYRDNFRANVDQYDEDTDYHDEDGNIQFKKNDKSNGRYHSDWLSMMYPRLKLARNLLKEDGVIFISIDDNEAANLKKISDEIFGEDNFVADVVVVNNLKGRNDKTYIATAHERMLMYVRSSEFNEYGLEIEAGKIDEYKHEDDNGKYRLLGLRKRGGADTRVLRPRMFYPFYINANDLTVSLVESDTHNLEVKPYKSDGTEGCWRWGSSTAGTNVDQLQANKVGERYDVFEKDYLYSDGEVKRIKPKSVLAGSLFSTDGATKAYRKLMPDVDFTSPKPVGFMRQLISYATSGDDIILDFFSGSATTAHAVMQLNAEDGGNRKWIMVQLPEETDDKSEAYKAGYKTIPDIARERIRRAGDKIAAEYPDAEVDYGFRALTIADTNYKDVYKPAGALQQSDLLASIDNIKDDRSELDLLYGVLTQSAKLLNRPIATTQYAGATVYQYDYTGASSGLVACFAPSVPEEAVKAIAALKPATAVFRDSSFADSQAKVNLAEHFRVLSPDTIVKVI
jgi:adenine-specific DNA-methyltransferase